MRRRILIVSASMGAGHDGAARELKRRLEGEGHEAQIVDFLDCCPFGIGWFIKWSYLAQLRFAPWTYELTYRLWYKMPSTWGFIVRLDTFVAGRRLRRAIEQVDADVVVSTYPLSSLVLGNMRKKRWLRVPVVTYLTDFAVHPLWVHPHVDLHLAVSASAAEAAATRSNGDARAAGPLVADRFSAVRARDRAAARRRLGLAPDERAVLVVAGSWGVGDVLGTVGAIAASGRYHPVTVCGRDEKLKVALEARGLGTVIGWTDEMPELMTACDAMVENAGGLTAMEAFASALPVVTYRPIAGHGRDNAEDMADSGVTRYARTDEELYAALDAITAPGPERDTQIARAAALFAGDASVDVVTLAHEREARGVVTPISVPRTPRRVAQVAAALLLVYSGLTVGAQGVAAFGVGIAHPPKTARDHAYLGVRLTAEELRDPQIVDQMAALHATAIVDGRTARTNIPSMRRLADSGIEMCNAGWGKGRPFRYLRSETDIVTTAEMIRRETGSQVTAFVPERRFDAFDQYWSRRHHQRLVQPDLAFKPESLPAQLTARRVYVLDGRERDPAAVEVALSQLDAQFDHAGLRVAPFAELR